MLPTTFYKNLKNPLISAHLKNMCLNLDLFSMGGICYRSHLLREPFGGKLPTRRNQVPRYWIAIDVHAVIGPNHLMAERKAKEVIKGTNLGITLLRSYIYINIYLNIYIY